MLNRTNAAHPMLTNLPAEIVELIACHLPWVDFCNFRLAGREPRIKSSDTFIKKFFTTKRILFTEHALTSLLTMLEHPHLFRTLKTIHFYAGPTLMVPRDGEALQLEMKGNPSPRTTEAEYLEYARDYEMFCFEGDGRFQALAHGIMQSIGRLDKPINISFDVCVCAERNHAAMTALGQRQVQPYADYAGYLRFDELGPTKERYYRNNTMITSMMVQPILKSAILVDAKIMTFCVGGWCECHVLDLRSMKAWDDDLNNLTRFTSKLETLQISLRGFRGDRFRYEHPKVIGNFVSMINASHGLKTLQLQFTWHAPDDAGNQELVKGLLQSHLPKLEYLVLDNMCCSANDLHSMLMRHQSTLKATFFRRLYLRGGTWRYLLEYMERQRFTQHAADKACINPESSLLPEALLARGHSILEDMDNFLEPDNFRLVDVEDSDGKIRTFSRKW